MTYITAQQFAEKHGKSEKRARILCGEGRVPGAYTVGEGTRCVWMIPDDAVWPESKRGPKRAKKGNVS